MESDPEAHLVDCSSATGSKSLTASNMYHGDTTSKNRKLSLYLLITSEKLIEMSRALQGSQNHTPTSFTSFDCGPC